MTLLSSVLLGLIQGIAEFLPISSSGHLAIAEKLLGESTNIPDFFDVLLHLGTLAAVFVAYWPDIRAMIFEFFQDPEFFRLSEDPVQNYREQMHLYF